MKPLAPNTLLQNRYLIVQLIGKGGMGEVYLAVDQRLGSAIAIKRTYFSEDEMLGVAFEREARTLARLRHPVLPKVSDHFLENENQYLVMEHISGDDLSKRLEANKKPFPLNWVLFWADQLLDALNYLHSHEPPIIHRDIKPQNLKLTDDNQIVLLDFGLAKDSVGQTKITTTGSVVGFTPHYAPMEQIRGTGTNPKSDIYSLSATLYQLLTNTVPFDALTRADSLLNGVADPVQPIHELNKEVPKLISEIIIKGMSVSQEQRFLTAREMQKTLRDAYSSIQSQMSAQTVAFNMQDAKPEEQAVTDNYATLVSEPPPMQERLDSTPLSKDENQESSAKTEVINQADFQKQETPVDFDATLKIEDFPAIDSKPKQADIKTEVFLADKISEQKEEQKETAKTESKPPEESPVSTADKTVPILSYDSQPKEEPVQKQDSVPAGFSENDRTAEKTDDLKTSEELSEQPDFLKTDYAETGNTINEKDEAPDFTPPPQFADDHKENAKSGQIPPPTKKSGGKGLLIGAGLFALLILFAGAGVAGWFVYKNYVAVDNPQPTPEASPSVEISPEISPEPTMAETNTEVTNTEITETDNTNSEVTNTNSGVVTTSTPKQTQTTRPTGQPTPRQTQVTTVRTPRPTPATTPVRQATPDRSKILKP